MDEPGPLVLGFIQVLGRAEKVAALQELALGAPHQDRAGVKGSGDVETVNVGTDFKKVGKAYVQQIERLRRVQAGLRDKGSDTRKSDPESTTVSIDPDISKRSLVTRQQHEDMPMVPGPEDLQ